MGLCVFAFLIPGFGGLIAVQMNLFAYVMGRGPASYGEVGFLCSALHQLGWFAIICFLTLHVGVAFYHQFIIKNNLLNRMWFSKEALKMKFILSSFQPQISLIYTE